VISVPPAAAERLEQGDGVAIAGRLRLHAQDERLLIRHLGVQQDQDID